MSVAEIKREIQSLSEEDRIYLAAWIKHLSRVNDPAYQAEVGRRIDTAREGKGHSLDQVERIHRSLKAEGL